MTHFVLQKVEVIRINRNIQLGYLCAPHYPHFTGALFPDSIEDLHTSSSD